jgi:hypothetical protein
MRVQSLEHPEITPVWAVFLTSWIFTRDNITVYDPLPMAHPFRNLTLDGIIADAKYGSHLLEQLQEGGGVRNVAAVEDEVEEDWVVIKDGESVALPGLGKHQLEAARPAQALRSGTSRKSRTHTRMSIQFLWFWITVLSIQCLWFWITVLSNQWRHDRGFQVDGLHGRHDLNC